MSYYARKDHFDDPEVVQGLLRIAGGHFDLSWLRAVERVRAAPSHPDRGLTLDDVSVGRYAHQRLPERIRTNFSMAPRGCELVPGLPHLGYQVNRKSDVWADNAPALFEEAKSRHWAPARDVPWQALAGGTGLTPDAERAHAQLVTDLAAMAICAGDVPARFVWLINHEFLEVVYFLCAQMVDAARLSEAFRKRALAGGAGLGRDGAELEELLKGVFDSPSYPHASAALNLALAGLVQLLCRHLAAAARNDADRVLFERATQDVSRFLAYGRAHVASLVAKRPAEAVALDEHLLEIENLMAGFLGSPAALEPLLVLGAGSAEDAASALPAVAALYTDLAREHHDRLRAAGLPDRRAESPLPRLAGLLR